MQVFRALSRCIALIRTWIAGVVRFIFSGFIITKFSNPHGIIYLTFDDGPCANTLVLAKELKQMNVPAGFFFNGDAVEGCKEVVEKIKADGFYIGNHSYSHIKYLWYQWKKELANIQKGEDILAPITQCKRIYRPPFGSIGPITFFFLLLKQYKIIHWNVDSRDFSATTIAEIITNIESVKSGDVLLFHSDSDLTVTHIRDIIAALSARGCRFGDLSNMIG